MHYLSVFDHRTNKRVAFLQNAYDVGYSLENNSLWTAQFTMPIGDPKNKYCKYLNYVEIYDEDKNIGLFRITPTRLTKNANTQEITYECEHVIATLMDDVLLGWHEIGNLGVYTPEVLRYILDQQTIKRWQLGECDYARQFLYGWENENLLSSLFSVPKPFADDYRWEYDTTSTPWIISLKKAPSEVKAEIRYRKNMLGIEKTEDPTNLCTRLYPFGYGEGVNKLTIASVNNGQIYIDANTIDEHGPITKIWIDQRYQQPQSLYEAAVAMLEELKNPYVSYTVNSLHTKELKNRTVGDCIRVIDDELGIDIYTRIIAISKQDIKGEPDKATITIANKSRNIATSIADLNDRQRISEAYSQGSVSLFTNHYYDNCSEEYPAEMRFYVPNNAVHINQVLLNGNAEPFRGYTKATGSDGATASTTSSGGGYYASTSDGGSTYTTTDDGGGTTSTSSDVTVANSNTEVDRTDDGGPGGANHNHGLARDDKIAIVDAEYNIIAYKEFSPSGKHTHGEHSHTVELPAHSHSLSLEPHTHMVNVEPHEHSFSIPAHTHAIQHGIYTGSTASRLTLEVDGNLVGTFEKAVSDLDIIPYLSTDESGNITRGWHNVSITPDILTRVEFDLVIQLFANSRGGGQY